MRDVRTRARHLKRRVVRHLSLHRKIPLLRVTRPKVAVHRKHALPEPKHRASAAESVPHSVTPERTNARIEITSSVRWLVVCTSGS